VLADELLKEYALYDKISLRDILKKGLLRYEITLQTNLLNQRRFIPLTRPTRRAADPPAAPVEHYF